MLESGDNMKVLLLPKSLKQETLLPETIEIVLRGSKGAGFHATLKRTGE